MLVSIKISGENYRRLCSLSGKLREEKSKPVSIDETITFLYNKRRVSDLAGSWNISDKEVGDFMANLKRGWSRWKIKSV